MKKIKWVAYVRGNKGLIAKVKVAPRSAAITILALSEYEQEKDESPVSKVLQLRTWLKKKKIPLKKLSLAISFSGVITRMITLPLLSAKDLEKLLTEQVAQYFTVNIDDYLVDYRIVEQIQEEGQKRLKVLVTALPKSHWEPMWTMWQQVGLEPKVVDLASDCLARLYSQLSKQGLPKAKEQSKDLAIVDIYPDGVEFLILEHGVFFLYSDLEVNLTELPPDPQDIPEDPELAERIQLDLAEPFIPVIRTLADFLSFFATRHFGKNVDEIYLTGELSSLPYIAQLFATELEIPTHSGFPDNWKPSLTRRVKFSENEWVRYGSLYGLALRED